MSGHRGRLRLRLGTGVSRHLWPVLFAAIAAAYLFVSDASTVHVTTPLAVGAAIAVTFFWVLGSRRYPLVPWFEAGAVYLSVVTLYMSYPLAGYLALGQTYTPLNDARLTALQPDAQEVGRIGWLYVWHLGAFAVSYVLARGRLPVPPPTLNRPRLPVFVAIVALFLAIELYTVFLGLFYDTSASTYAGSYIAARSLPLVFQQLLNHLSGIKYVLSIMLLAALFSRYPSSRNVILGWIVLAAVVTVSRLGSRTDLVLLVMSAAIMYNTVIRPIPPRLLAMVAACGLVGFVTFGIVRNGVGFSGDRPRNPFAYASEFENLFANAVHLERVKDSVGDLPASFYFADLGALVPQQIAPFTKVDRADWYVNRFFPEYAAMGGGLAFGTIAEVVLTGGWISAALRGLAVGCLLAALHRFYTRHPHRFWVFVFYVWVTTLSYQAFRNSTFSLLVLIVYRFVPALLVVNIVATGIRRAVRVGPADQPLESSSA